MNLGLLHCLVLMLVIVGCAQRGKALRSNRLEAGATRAGLILPEAPRAVGNYQTYAISGNLIFINQIALHEGRIVKSGTVDKELSPEEAKAATRQAMLNVLAVLNSALKANSKEVIRCVQLSGHFLSTPDFKQHAALLDEASKLVVDVLGEQGVHTRGAFGASSLPLGSPVEIQAIFEIR
jgi:NAD(P)H dehydrogenase (quinone)